MTWKKGYIPWNKGVHGVLRSSKKGKIYEDIYGLKKAKQIKKKISAYQLGKPKSLKHRQKISESNKGKIISIESKDKIRKTLLNYFNTHKSPMFGKNLSEKTKNKIRQKNLGKIPWNKGIKMKDIDANYINAFKGKNHTKETKEINRQYRLNQIFPTKDTKIEKLVCEELIKRNIKFEKNKTIFGRPDIFIEPNICIFCDGDYWHANPKKYNANDIINRQHQKSAKQIWARDLEVTKKLISQDYIVMRFWETDILKDIKFIGTKIESLMG